MTKLVHRFAGIIALLTIATFWLSTVFAELFASDATVRAVKMAVPWGFFFLVPALAAAGASGFAAAKGKRGRVIDKKIRRMPFIAGNGLLVLIPSAFFLSSKASAAEFDATFYVVQVIELIAGATNIMLLGLNMRDGFKLTGRFRSKKSVKAAMSQ